MQQTDSVTHFYCWNWMQRIA